MSKFIINGGPKINGEIDVNGAKNAVLPILAATILNEGTSIIHHCPKIQDVYTMLEILEIVGAKVSWEDHSVIIDTSSIDSFNIPENLVRKMRSSIILMGAFLSKYREVEISYPGGCSLGPRPIDLHLKALKQMGASFVEEHGFIYAKVRGKLRGAKIYLGFPSVGATENVMLAAILGDGITVIQNAAKEPEIVDLQNFLNAMGANITGAGSDTIVIEGVEKLQDVEYTVMGDRIEAGTYLVAAAITKGEIILKNTPIDCVQSCIAILERMGMQIRHENDILYLKGAEFIQPVDLIVTRPYPGFPTDMQPQFMSLLTLAKGTSIIKETVFSSRYKHAEELMRMGADILPMNEIAVIKGKEKITGAEVQANDLRGGAALVLAALAAEGKSTVLGGEYIERGYEAIEEKLKQLGADITKIN